MCHFTFMEQDNNQPANQLTNLSADTDPYLFRSIHGIGMRNGRNLFRNKMLYEKASEIAYGVYNTLEIQSINGLSNAYS